MGVSTRCLVFVTNVRNDNEQFHMVICCRPPQRHGGNKRDEGVEYYCMGSDDTWHAHLHFACARIIEGIRHAAHYHSNV